MTLAEVVYAHTADFPKHELYGLTSQIKRCAVSIPSNVAEGAGRQTRKELVNFLHIAQGLLSELDTQLDLALRLKYMGVSAHKELNALMIRVDKMLTAFIKAEKRKTGRGKA